MILQPVKTAALLCILFVSILGSTVQAEDRILIAYFTWADNTVILDRERAVREANGHVFSMENRAAVDGVTSASVVPPGNTARLAGWIQERTGGDLYSIKVVDKYSCYWDECLDRASREKARKVKPEMAGYVQNMAEYDVVFLGFPTWWYTIPMAVANFVESHDFEGKTIIPFVSHGTSGKARTIRDLKSILPSRTVLKQEIGVYRSETAASEDDINMWLGSLGF